VSNIINRLINPLGIKITRIDSTDKVGNHFALDSESLDYDKLESNKLLNLLNYTKKSASGYSATLYESAYHSIRINGVDYQGQRQPLERLKQVDFDFTDKNVLDIGCNQGGMLFALSEKIKHGIGIDFDSRMINVANRIKASNKLTGLDFFVFDLEHENLDIALNFLPKKNIDIVFLLSVCMWIPNWHEVIRWSHSLANNLLFESNGSDEQQREQIDFIKELYTSVNMIIDHSPDDPKQHKRKLFLCSH